MLLADQHGLKYYFNTTAYAQLVTALEAPVPCRLPDAQAAPYATDYSSTIASSR